MGIDGGASWPFTASSTRVSRCCRPSRSTPRRPVSSARYVRAGRWFCRRRAPERDPARLLPFLQAERVTQSPNAARALFDPARRRGRRRAGLASDRHRRRRRTARPRVLERHRRVPLPHARLANEYGLDRGERMVHGQALAGHRRGCGGRGPGDDRLADTGRACVDLRHRGRTGATRCGGRAFASGGPGWRSAMPATPGGRQKALSRIRNPARPARDAIAAATARASRRVRQELGLLSAASTGRSKFGAFVSNLARWRRRSCCLRWCEKWR